jgi:hypothetical protein
MPLTFHRLTGSGTGAAGGSMFDHGTRRVECGRCRDDNEVQECDGRKQQRSAAR